MATIATFFGFSRQAVAGLAGCALLLTGAAAPAAAGNGAQGSDDWREIETKYIFGFTSGSGIGLQGEQEFSIDTVGRFGKRDGRYTATETKFEYETTPTQFIQLEFGVLASTHDILGVTDLDDRRHVALSGAFAELRYLMVERTSLQPLAMTLSFEPTWRRVDETGGDPVTNFEYEFKLNADLELVRNRLYAGFNLLYEPEVTRTALGEYERESKLGVSAALALRIHPNVVVGAEAWYLRHYDGIALEDFTGDAVMVGPTLFVQLSRKTFLTAAWNTQVWGREMGADQQGGGLNLAEFQRHRARLKWAVEF